MVNLLYIDLPFPQVPEQTSLNDTKIELTLSRYILRKILNGCHFAVHRPRRSSDFITHDHRPPSDTIKANWLESTAKSEPTIKSLLHHVTFLMEAGSRSSSLTVLSN